MKKIVTLTCILYCTLFLFACAQPPATKQPETHQESLDSQYQQIAKIAREHLSEAQLSDGSHVPEETPEELAKPILPDNEIKNTVDHGIFTVIVEVCKLDSKKEFFRYMDGQRSRKLWSDKQMAYMGLLHGVSMGISQDAIQKKGCPAEMKQKVMKQLQ